MTTALKIFGAAFLAAWIIFWLTPPLVETFPHAVHDWHTLIYGEPHHPNWRRK